MDNLEQAISAIKEGDRQGGRRLLLVHLRENPEDVRAWLWLASVTKDPQRRAQAFERVLEIDPGNQTARKQLSRLQESAEPSPDSAARRIRRSLEHPVFQSHAFLRGLAFLLILISGLTACVALLELNGAWLVLTVIAFALLVLVWPRLQPARLRAEALAEEAGKREALVAETNNQKECPFCYSAIDARATICPNCRKDQPKTKEQQQRSTLSCLGLLAVGALLAIVFVYGDIGSDSCQSYYYEVSRVKSQEWDNADIAAVQSQDRNRVEDLLPQLRAGQQALRAIDAPDCAGQAHGALLSYTQRTIDAHVAFVNGSNARRTELLKQADAFFGIWAREIHAIRCEYETCN